ncbi:MAG: serine/threonine-protein phosphatase [Planctomycetes bacterium]|nr:serine/threonine-protein phosphatase [Planctomycetota bacterium]
MAITHASAELLARLPAAFGHLALFVCDEQGAVVERHGEDQGSRVSAGGDGPQVATANDRAALQVHMPGGGHIIATFPQDSPAASLIAALLAGLCQREQLELDMESMNTSSLQLLEQVAMLGETLPKLSAGETDAEIAAMGLKACVVAAGVERAVFLTFHQETGLCEALVHIVADDAGQANVAPYPADDFVPADRGWCARVLGVDETMIQDTVPSGQRLGEPGSPEHLAARELIGVPVSYGSGPKRVVLGALLVMDKRRSSYSTQEHLGSQEGQVATSFAAMLGAVLGARKTAELGKELHMAQVIQGQILPERPAQVPGFDLAGDYQTCGEVGGDYFDYVHLADGRTMVVVADVSGHNLASGMMMVSARATLRTLASVRGEPARLFSELAATMYRDLTRTERFLTAAAVVLQPGSHEVEIVSAGHNDLMVYRTATGEVERLASESTILGFLPAPEYESRRVHLQAGDFLFLYTDGITEACDPNGDMFGEDQLASVLQQAAAGTARQIVAMVLASLHRHRGKTSRADDVTAVVVRAVADTGARP